MPFSSLINDSINCSPFLPSQIFTIANCSVWGVLYVINMIFTSNLKVLSLLYLSSASQMKVGCFMAGLSILHPAVLCGISAVAAAKCLYCCSGCLCLCLGDCFTYYYLFTCHTILYFLCLPK